MSSEPFINRVQALRSSWNERRRVRTLASSHDFDARFQLLLLLREWAAEAAEDIRAVYGDEMTPALSGEPTANGRPPSFTLALAPGYAITFELVSRSRAGSEHWTVATNVTSAGTQAPAGRHRSGQWTRAQLEEAILSLLAAYERSLVSNASPAS